MTETKSFVVRFTTAAQREFDHLGSQLRDRMVKHLRQLESNPFPSGSEKLSNRAATYRIRVGDYRILYEIDVSTITIWIKRIAHRREVYR